MLSLRSKILGKCREIRKISVELEKIKNSPEPERMPGESELSYKLRQLRHSCDKDSATFMASPLCYPSQDLSDNITRARYSCSGKFNLLLLDLTEYYAFINEYKDRQVRGYN